jgi:hypothetical protein
MKLAASSYLDTAEVESFKIGNVYAVAEPVHIVFPPFLGAFFLAFFLFSSLVRPPPTRDGCNVSGANVCVTVAVDEERRIAIALAVGPWEE